MEAVESPADPPESDETPSELRPVDRWRRNTATGAVVAAFALGFQQVFDPERKDTVAIEQEAPGEPVDPERVELHFDPTSSTGSVVVVRPPAGGTQDS